MMFNEAVSNNCCALWTEIKRIKGRNMSVASCVDNANCNNEIFQLFAKKYSALYIRVFFKLRVKCKV